MLWGSFALAVALCNASVMGANGLAGSARCADRTPQRGVHISRDRRITALLPLLCLWPSIIGAHYALYLVLRYRKSPCSITGMSNLAFAAAGTLAVLELAGWVIFLVYVIVK